MSYFFIVKSNENFMVKIAKIYYTLYIYTYIYIGYFVLI